MGDVFYSFSCTYCHHETNAGITGISNYGRVKCPACGEYYKCYKIKCKKCRQVFTPNNRYQEEAKVCSSCAKLQQNNPPSSMIYIEIEAITL